MVNRRKVYMRGLTERITELEYEISSVQRENNSLVCCDKSNELRQLENEVKRINEGGDVRIIIT